MSKIASKTHRLMSLYIYELCETTFHSPLFFRLSIFETSSSSSYIN